MQKKTSWLSKTFQDQYSDEKKKKTFLHRFKPDSYQKRSKQISRLLVFFNGFLYLRPLY